MSNFTRLAGRRSATGSKRRSKGRTAKGRTVLFASLLVVLELGLAGCDLARLQEGLVKPSPAVLESAERSAVQFTPPPPITDYEYFDVAVEDGAVVRVHTRETASATANIYMIHGAGGGSWAWEEFFDHIPENYNLYALSWRGHFESSHVEDANAADYVRDQIAGLNAIKTRNDLTVHVIGHSYGAATSVLMAAQPDVEFASLHLLAPVAPLDYSVTQRILVPIVAPAFIATENEADGVFGDMFLSKTRMHHWFNAYAGQSFSAEKRGLITGDGVSPAWQQKLAAAYEALKARDLPVAMLIAQYDNVVVPRRQHIAADLAGAAVTMVESGHYIALGTKSEDIAHAITLNITELHSGS